MGILKDLAILRPLPMVLLMFKYIFFHHSKLSIEKIGALGGVDEIAKKQGFYIYRGKRLIVEGGWLGLAKSSQLGKL